MSYIPQFPNAPQPGAPSNANAPQTNHPTQTGAPQQGTTAPYPPGYGPPPPTPINRPGAAATEPQYPPQNNGAQYPPQFGQQQAYYPPPQLPPQPQHIPPTLLYAGLIVPNPHAPPLPYGVTKVPAYDPSADAEVIRKATKGFGTNDELLIKTLTKIPILEMDALADYYVSKNGKRLVELLDSETSSYFGMGIHALATGPLAWDIELLHKALDGAGTNEDLLTEVLLGRSNEDIYHLTVGYKLRYGVDLAVKIKNDLSGKTERLYLIALNANRPPDSTPVDQAAVDKDIEALFEAGQGKKGKDEDPRLWEQVSQLIKGPQI